MPAPPPGAAPANCSTRENPGTLPGRAMARADSVAQSGSSPRAPARRWVVAFRHPEQQVVAEAVGAAGFAEDRPSRCPRRRSAAGRRRESAPAPALTEALLRRARQDILHGLQQLGVVRRVAPAVGIARRVDARRAAEGSHRQPGVVGQRRQGGKACGVAFALRMAFDEGKTGFPPVPPWLNSPIERTFTLAPSMAWSSLSLPALWLASTSCSSLIIRPGRFPC